MIITPDFQRAISEVDAMLGRKRQTSALFIDGGAGTGKSTLIRHLRDTIKNSVVVAPTGVAATITGGTTIHRLFHFPSKVLVPHQDRENSYPSPVLRKMSALIVDEVGMVRADMIAGMDYYLRRATRRMTPFGGIPTILVGDPFQLPPVLRQEERQIFDKLGHKSEHFFGANVWSEFGLQTVTLRQVHRQADERFAGILNRVREGTPTEEDLNELNTRVGVPVPPNTVTRTPTRRRAEEINRTELNKLPEPDQKFSARMTGDFRPEDAIAEPELILRRGALVMLLNNDKDHRWQNGTTGNYHGTRNGRMVVELSSGTTVELERHTWERFRYKWDSAKNEVTQVKLGEMSQFPVKVAYAVTIHKGQGQTLDRCNVDFGNGFFAPGMAYVALSRVKTLDGLFLSRKLERVDCMVDPAVQEFYANGCNPNADTSVAVSQQPRRTSQLALFG